MFKTQVQTALRVMFPPSCAGCGEMVDREFALCGACWRELPLISGPVCQSCGKPILAEQDQTEDRCDDCFVTGRPWSQGRAAMQYRGMARKLVLALKHGDRQDIAMTVANWMAQAARPLLLPDTVIVPVPLHWSRMIKRKYNQAALLSQYLGLKTGHAVIVDGLQRPNKTRPLEKASFSERFDRLDGAIVANPKRAARLAGLPVLIVDDVMTSGATLAAATEACLAAGADRVDVLTLARVGKDD